MKDYLHKFRTQAFDGTMSLFKRVLLPNIILNIIVTIIFSVLFFVMIAVFGLSVAQMASGLDKESLEAMRASGDPNAVNALVGRLIDDIGIGFIITLLLFFLFVGSWVYYLFLKLNDNEVREKNNSIFTAIGRSFSPRVFTIIGFILLMIVINIAVLFIYGLISSLLLKIPILGIIIAFVGYFVVVIFLLRFIAGIPAIAHGNMSVMDALQFSYKNITWKRAGLIFLAILVSYVILLLVTLVSSFILAAGSVSSAIVFMILFILMFACISTFAFSALSALYFRYSNDESESEVEQHLVS